MIWLGISGIGLILVIGLAIAAAFVQKNNLKAKYYWPNWTSMGISLGIPIGIGIGLAIDSFALGIAIGVAIGSAFSIPLQKKYGNKIKLNKENRQKIWMLTLGLVITLILGVLAFAVFAYLSG